MNIRHQALFRCLRAVAAALLALLGIFGPAASAQGERVAVVLTLDGVVGPATADYISRGIEQAAEREAGLVVLRMDTPGGLDTSMRDIIREILASPVPVASFVTPAGARAASAGTYILYASHDSGHQSGRGHSGSDRRRWAAALRRRAGQGRRRGG